jgi:hypothetical protein
MPARTITDRELPRNVTEDANKNSRGRSLLFVHGRGFKPDRETLLSVSLSAVRAGIGRDYPDHLAAFDGLHSDIAYYGDLSSELLAAHGHHCDVDLDIGDRKNALQQLREIPARKRFGIRQYDRLPGKSAVPEFVADFIYPVFGLFGLALPIIGRMSRDFGDYLRRKSDFATKVQERVRTSLCAMLDRGDQLMLLTHGTGSVVVYDVLWQLSHDPELSKRYGAAKVDMWVTLGSPLGDRNVRKRLEGAGRTSAPLFPTNIISWRNVSAEDDYTCHDKTLADDFKKMLRQRMVSEVTDYRIFNHAVRYGRSNPHSSIGYYIHPRLSKIIADWIDPC